jgi:Tfp pilus assembly protein PilF
MEEVGRSEAAAEAYIAAVEYWPESSAALFGLANAYYAAGDLVKAERTYRLSLERDPGSAAVLNNLAQVLLDQGRCTEALEEIGRALGLPNSYPELLDALTDSRDAITARCTVNQLAEPAGT